MLFVYVFLAFILYYLYNFYSKVRKLPSGPFPLPIIGNVYQLDFKYPHKTLDKWGKQYGSVYTAWITDPNVVLTDYKTIKEALVKQGDTFAGRPRLFLLDIIYKGNFGLISSDGQKWKEQRRFSLHVLRDFGFGRPLMEEKILAQTASLLEYMNEKLEKTNKFSVKPYLELCVGNIISDMLFSHTFDNDLGRFERYKELLDNNFKLIRSAPALLLNANAWLRYVPLFDNFGYDAIKRNVDEVFSFFDEEIEKHEKNLDMDATPDDFLTAYLQEKAKNELQSFSDWQTKTAIADLWVAGMETTVTTLRWAVLYMVLYPDVQSAVQQEIDDQLGPSTTVSMSDRNKMPYTAATIAEIQRKANIVPLNVQHKTTQDTVIDGHHIPAGTTVLPQVTSVLTDATYFKSPDEFRPERFLENDGNSLNIPEQVVPFSMGKRQCLGEPLARMELFLIFVSILQKYKFSVPKVDKKPTTDTVFGITLVPHDFECFVESR